MTESAPGDRGRVTPEGDDRLADRIAEAVHTHPAVARLDGGVHGTIAAYLPGRQVTGVRASGAGEPVEVGVVLRMTDPLPEIVAALRQRVLAVTGPVPVDITVVDVITSDDADAPSGSEARGR
ncbi:hypothetical protein [Saccharopolyspora gloriosae]|uniref:Asp23/Gls24 family envelope stress response protein n=1 Tax=Saccharopolyspora gloriosae TaxID=455344 RepID=A0A840ND99_9PSEU|nr:hypothetical protein [Saccharopolyspora gloriosae]MBB5068293.1 hypothetical protein [Saccharopolyspora gloriosae]